MFCSNSSSQHLQGADVTGSPYWYLWVFTGLQKGINPNHLFPVYQTGTGRIRQVIWSQILLISKEVRRQWIVCSGSHYS